MSHQSNLSHSTGHACVIWPGAASTLSSWKNEATNDWNGIPKPRNSSSISVSPFSYQKQEMWEAPLLSFLERNHPRLGNKRLVAEPLWPTRISGSLWPCVILILECLASLAASSLALGFWWTHISFPKTFCFKAVESILIELLSIAGSKKLIIVRKKFKEDIIMTTQDRVETGGKI